MHLEALVLCGLILIACGLLGYATVAYLGRYEQARTCLLAPVAGLAIFLLIAAGLSRLGVPMRVAAVPVFGMLLAVNVAYIIARRPQLRRMDAFAWSAALVAVVAIVGWPLAVDGFDWISTGNGDMSNYVLAANHFYAHGFYEMPPMSELMRDTVPSWDTSFFYSFGEVRWGAQLLVACAMALTGLTAAQIYMTLAVALHAIVGLATAGLVYTQAERRKAALATLLALGCSSAFAAGLFAQLIPQDLGLAGLVATAAVLLDLSTDAGTLRRRAFLGAILLAYLMLVYPELSPFMVVAAGAFVAINIIRVRLPIRRMAEVAGITVAGVIMCANATLPGAVNMISSSAREGTAGAASFFGRFPDFLTPLGAALGWGLVPRGADSASPIVQFAIVCGVLLSVAAIAITVRAAWQLRAEALVCGAMMLVYAWLFTGSNGFGLFKLAMYIQPFLTATMAGFVIETLRAQPSARTVADMRA